VRVYHWALPPYQVHAAYTHRVSDSKKCPVRKRTFLPVRYGAGRTGRELTMPRMQPMDMPGPGVSTQVCTPPLPVRFDITGTQCPQSKQRTELPVINMNPWIAPVIQG
jgi:hypothetical protein